MESSNVHKIDISEDLTLFNTILVIIGIVLIMIFLPLILAYVIFILITGGFKEKCKYINSCKLYDEKNKCCNKDGGEYMISKFEGFPASCYKKMERNYDKFYK